MVAVLESEDQFKEIIASSGLVVVDFFATWCGPCKMIAPLLEKFSQQYTDVKFIKIDVDLFPGIAQDYEVSTMPTLKFIKDGKVLQTVLGANPAAIKSALAAHAA